MKGLSFDKKAMLYNAPIFVSVFLIILLLMIPTGFEDAVIFKEAQQCVAKVLSIDNSDIVVSGLISSGEQSCRVEILNGPFKGEIARGVNNLSGLFVTGLIIFAGKTGARAVLSFTLSILLIWKLLVPLYLKGYQPIITGLFVSMILAFVIISLVFGFNKKFYAAFLGVSSGILLTCILGVAFTNLFKIHGAVIGSANMGTMTTTLLLAYSGGYISLLMVFMAQGTPVANILNYKYVSAEIVETIVGSFGLLTVAPLTAVICGLLFVKQHH